ncbi:NEAT domain-containing protein [Levilactobacillus parabrevis]|uniref:NEAT domain-containing protein n=1 Tax=Levilactobacillus parabrevis TaxID=357278 RepID=UPI0004840A8F|nr:NEAT domain-containing protein [Levilactobacillus parabrevis]
MRKLRQSLHIIGLIVVGLLAMVAFGGQQAQAATLDDGIYVVPTKIIKANSTATSTANQFFGNDAAVRIKGDQTTVLMTSNGAQYIKSMTIAGQKATVVKTVNGQAIYQVNLTKQASPLPATFSLTTPVGSMKESARLVLTWAKAEKDNTSTNTADLLKQATALTATATSSSSTVSVPKSTTAAKTAPSSAKTTATTPTTQYWKYQVLKADTMSPSDANQYYTHTAKVTPTQHGYRVTLTVSYAKSLKLGPKAVVPKTVDGVAVPAGRVTYGQSGQNYTMTYWFDIQHTSELTAKLIPGKIHVTVPAMNISETFPIRFRFATSGSADQATAAAVAALPTTKNKQTSGQNDDSTVTPTTHHVAKATLPATGEEPSSWAILGLIGLSVSGGLLVWEAKRHAQD